MKTIQKVISATFLLIFFLGLTSNTWAQRNVSYRDLAMRDQERPASFDFIVLPGSNDQSVTFTSVFSFSYSYLPFKKMNRQQPDKQFYSTANLSMEVFKSDRRFRKAKRNDNISLEGLEPVGRTFWADTAYAKSYDESQSKSEYLRGHMEVSLPPGSYNYVLQMKRGEETDSRISRTQFVRIEPYDKMSVGNIIVGTNLTDDHRLLLSERGSSVEYAKDFYLMAYLPNYKSDSKYSLAINKLSVADQDTSQKSQVYQTSLSSKDIQTGLRPTIGSTDNKAYIDLQTSQNGYTYALLKIPNSNFENSLYRVTITKEGEKKPVAQGTYRSLWVDMPTSLLNLDVAIDMLRFIADDKTIDNISSGSRAERERKFREFWEKRDPTPNTEFNELMAEYYRRIDYAYRNFTTNSTLGYNSDQGEVYIKFGAPQNIDRRFPTNGPTTEIWTYKDRQFVFKATTGFGDFKLVKDESK